MESDLKVVSMSAAAMNAAELFPELFAASGGVSAAAIAF